MSGTGFQFFSDARCTTAITQQFVATGQSTVTFYFRHSTMGSQSLNVAATGYSSASQSETVLSAPVPFPSYTFDLGPLPGGMAVTWPTAPIISRTVEVRTAAQLVSALATAGSRIYIQASIPDSITIRTNDHEIIAGTGVILGTWTVARSVHRLRFYGGTYTGLVLEPPKVWWPSEETNPAWFVTDVMFSGIRVNAPNEAIALTLRGIRIAVIRSVLTAGTYSVWFGDHAPAQASDVIFAGNHMRSGGAEATLRVHDANNVVAVENVLINGTEWVVSKHNLRLHGTINRLWVARNTLVYSGTMVGISSSGDTDQIGTLWYESNLTYMTRPSLFQADAGGPPYLRTAFIRNNTTYSNQPWHTCLVCNTPLPPGWTVTSNPIFPYRSPPASVLTR